MIEDSKSVTAPTKRSVGMEINHTLWYRILYFLILYIFYIKLSFSL